MSASAARPGGPPSPGTDQAGPEPGLDLAIEDERWRALGDVGAIVASALAVGARVAKSDPDKATEICVLLTDDAALRSLNKQWRGLDKPTNVLSFPSGQPAGPSNAGLGPRHLGDVAIAWETVTREAADGGRSVAAHLSHLVIHGFLHLVGEDHESPGDADRMEALERRALALLGYSDPYARSEPAEPAGLQS